MEPLHVEGEPLGLLRPEQRAKEVAVVRTGRGEDSVYVAIQHMKNHVWREVWPAMPAASRAHTTTRGAARSPPTLVFAAEGSESLGRSLSSLSGCDY